MAGKPAVIVTGAAETQRALRRMADSLDDPDTHRPAGEAAKARALDLVPRVSGDLASTIDVTTDGGGSELVAGSPMVPYAGVIDYGWDARGIEAQPYLADPSVGGDIHDAYADEIGDLVKRVGRES